MDGSKEENTEGSKDGGAVPIKRVLRSRIVEVDTNSNGSTVNDGVDSAVSLAGGRHNETTKTVLSKESLESHSTPVKRNLRNRTTSSSSLAGNKNDAAATPKNMECKEISVKITTPEDHKKTSLAEDNESHSSLSPVSQCGSETSSVSVRVLRNSKCVIIPLEYTDKTSVIDGSVHVENVESKKNTLSSINEEDEKKEIDIKEKEDGSCASKGSEEVLINKGIDADSDVSKENNKESMCGTNEKNVDSVNVPSGSEDLSVIDNTDKSDQQVSDKVVDSVANDDNDNRKEVEVTAEDTKCQTVTSRDQKENPPSLDEGKEVVIEVTEVEEKDQEGVLKTHFNVEDSPSVLENDDSNRLKESVKETENNIENLSVNDSVEKDKTVEDTATIPANCVTSVSVEELQESQGAEMIHTAPSEISISSVIVEVGEEQQADDIDSSVAVDGKSDKSTIDSNDDGIQILEIEDIDDASLLDKSKERESVQEELTENTVVKEQGNKDKDECGDENKSAANAVYDVEQAKGNQCISKGKKEVSELSSKPYEDVSLNKNSISESRTVLSEDKRGTSRLNLSNVLNLLSVEKNKKDAVVREDLLDSSEKEDNAVASQNRIRKHVTVDPDPVEYHGIGKDQLKDIMKEVITSAFGELKQEIDGVKQQITNVTNLLNELKRGKKRKFLESFFEDLDSDDNETEVDTDRESLPSAAITTDNVLPKIKASPSEQDLSPSKVTKTKDDLITELLGDVSDHLQVPVKAGKKMKLSKSQRDLKEEQNKLLNVEKITLKNEGVGLMDKQGNDPTQSAVSDVNKKKKAKKKKKLNLSQENIVGLWAGTDVKEDEIMGKPLKAQEINTVQCTSPVEISSGEVKLSKKKKKLKLKQENTGDLLTETGVKKDKIVDKLLLPQEINILPHISPIEGDSGEVIPKKRKKMKTKDVKNVNETVFEKESDDFTGLFDVSVADEVVSKIKEVSKEQKKKKKNKNLSNLSTIIDGVTAASNFADNNFNSSTGLSAKKKKKKKRLDLLTGGSSFDNEMTSVTENLFPECNETEIDKKKKKNKDKLNNLSFNKSVNKKSKLTSPDGSVINTKKGKFLHSNLPSNKDNNSILSDNFVFDGSSSQQLQKLKKKKKKQKLQSDEFLSTSAIYSNPSKESGEEIEFEGISFGNTIEEKMVKKMKSQKNSNKLYRVTPYKDNKKKKIKFGSNVDF